MIKSIVSGVADWPLGTRVTPEMRLLFSLLTATRPCLISASFESRCATFMLSGDRSGRPPDGVVSAAGGLRHVSLQRNR